MRTGRVSLMSLTNEVTGRMNYNVNDTFSGWAIGRIEYSEKHNKYIYDGNTGNVRFDRDCLLIEVAEIVSELNGEGD